MYQTLLTALENNIYIITINRPDKLNALSKTVFDALIGDATDARIQTEDNLTDLVNNLLWKPIV